MRKLLLSVALAAAAAPAMAFDPTGYTEADLKAFVTALIAGVNCAQYSLNDPDYDRLVAAGDAVAANLKVSVDDYDALYYKPAFNALGADETKFCATEGPKVAGMVAKAR